MNLCGTRNLAKNHEYLWNRVVLKNLIFLLKFFCPTGTLLGCPYGERYGVSICHMVTKFVVTVLGVPQFQKTIPGNVELPPHFAEA